MSKRLTVVQVLPALQSGGVEKGTLEVAEALVQAGHRSIVISAGGQLVEKLQQQGNEHIEWDLGKKSPLTFLQTGKFRTWIHDNRVDIIHARSRMPAWVAYRAWKKMPENSRPRFITTVHGLNSVSRYSKIMTAGEVVIAVSDTVKKYVLDHYPDVPEQKIRVIHRGIDPDEFPFGFRPGQQWLEQWYTRFPQTKEKWLITLPGRLTRLKGHHDFIKIIAQLKTSVPNLHGLVVGGEDPKRKAYAQDLYKTVADKGLQNDITFAGYHSDMKEIYALSDVILSLSSKPESFGRTSVEALSLGVGVIGYQHGGVGETLSELYPQGLVPPNSPEMVISRCQALYQGTIAPPGTAQTTYLQENMVNETLALYERISMNLT